LGGRGGLSDADERKRGGIGLHAAKAKGIPLHLFVTEQDRQSFTQLCAVLRQQLALNQRPYSPTHVECGASQPPLLCDLRCATYRHALPDILAKVRDYQANR
jgi:hypothetical protein